MTSKEKVNRNIGLTFDFLRQIVKDATLLKSIPDGSILEFVDKDFPEMERKEEKTGIKSKKKYLRVKSNLEVI